MYSPARQRGNISENIVAQYIENNAYKTLARNYLRKWGEIDIIAVKNNIVHFIEVKSIFSHVPHETKSDSVKTIKTGEYIDGFSVINVSHETKSDLETSNFAPFDPVWNMTIKKRKSMVKAIKSYIAENYKEEIPDFQIDLATVSLDYFNKTAYITFIDNIILEDM